MIPLFDHALEAAVINCLLYENEAYEKIEFLSSEDFNNSFYKKVFKVVVNKIVAGFEITVESLLLELDKKYAAKISSFSPQSAANITYYADKVRELSIKRKLSSLCEKCIDQIKSLEQSPDIIENLESNLTGIDENNSDIKTLKELAHPTLKKIEKDHKTHGISGIETGLKDLDYKTGGFQAGDFLVVGARPSIGKTALGMGFAEAIAKKDIPVAVFSLEMSGEALLTRMICANSQISQVKIRRGELTDSDLERLHYETSKIYDLPLYICDRPNIQLSEIKIKSRRLKRTKDIKLILIDYLSLIKVTGDAPRWQLMGQASAELKSLARELNVPIIALSQVGRQSEGKRPTLADLRESGSIEQDADVVMFLHRERGAAETELIIEKSRNSLTGVVNLYFKADETKFYPLSQHR